MEKNNNLFNKIIIEDMEKVFDSIKNISMLKNKVVFVSGATGMIASYMVFFMIFLNEYHSYNIGINICFRNINKARQIYGNYLNKDYMTSVIQDINEKIDLNKNVDYIFHTASFASPQFYGSYPVETMLPNLIGTNNLLNFAKENACKKFIFFSSGAVYGKNDNTECNEDFSGELDFLNPGSVYGESKRCGEALCFAYSREYGLPVNCVRIHHTYGPTMDIVNDKRAFSEFVKNIVNNENIVIHSDGLQKRAFCYLSDAISAIFNILLIGGKCECYNLANINEFYNINELADLLINLFPEKKLKVIHTNKLEKGYLNLSQTQSLPCSTAKIKELGCEFKVNAIDGFRRTILYFMEKKENKICL